MSLIAKSMGLMGIVLLALTACGTNSAGISEALPLAEDQPTFVFFLTDN